jgi:hypothetical protein
MDAMDLTKYKEFLFGEDYLPPVGKTHYLISELQPFFEQARIALDTILSSVGKPSPVNDIEQIHQEYHLLGHGKTGTNAQRKLTGWSGDMLTWSYNQDGILKIGGIEQALLQAGIAKSEIDSLRPDFKEIPDNSLGVLSVFHSNRTEENKFDIIDINEYSARFVSDLPRAIQHALLLTGDMSLAKELIKLGDQNRTHIEPHVYNDLMNLALDYGFIPTPLIRAQYYGPMELGPEKVKAEMDAISCMIEAKHGVALDDLITGHVNRKRLLKSITDSDGRFISEMRPDLIKRLTYFYETVQKKIQGKILAVTSSGCIDVSPAVFRYFESNHLDLQNPKNKVRGKVLVAKLGEFNGNQCYLNDSEKLDDIKATARNRISSLRDLSVDAHIRDGSGIIEIPLVNTTSNSDVRIVKQKKQNLDFLLKSSKSIFDYDAPIIIFGHGGQGKTILSTSIADSILEQKIIGYENMVPVMEDCGELSLDHKDYIWRHGFKDYLIKQYDKLPQSIKESSKLALIFDNYHQLNDCYREEFHSTVRGLNAEGHKVFLLSRKEETDLQSATSDGYEAIEINGRELSRKWRSYCEGRIDSYDVDDFREYLSAYDNDITDNLLTLFFLTQINPYAAESDDSVLEYITGQSIREKIKQGQPLSRFELFSAQSDYMNGTYIRREQRIPPGPKLREATVRLNEQLAEFALLGDCPE